MPRAHRITNWSRTGSFCPNVVHHPTSASEILVILADAERRSARVRVVGSGWSPLLSIVHCVDTVVWMDQMSSILSIDRHAKTVTVQAGATLAQLNRALEAEGLAFSNLPSVSGQTIGGAIATATHGSGMRAGLLSSAVLALEIATPAKGVLRLTRASSSPLFWAACCSLGVLGVVTEVTLQVEDAYALSVEQEPRTLDDVLVNFESVARSAEYVRFWWYPHTDWVLLNTADRVPPALAPPPRRPSLLSRLLSRVRFNVLQSALLASWIVTPLVPIINRVWRWLYFSSRARAIVCPIQFFNFDCLFMQHVDEWAVPLSEAAAALTGLRSLIEFRGYRAHFPVEVRFVPRDSVWLSNAHERDVVYIGVISYRPFGIDIQDFRKYFADFDALMLRFGGRPHWAKDHPLGRAELAKLYPKFEEFRQVRAQLDPASLLGNAYTDRLFEPGAA